MENPNRAEAERLLGIAEKLLQNRDFGGSRDFAILAQETEPLLDGSDQILAIADVILASEKRINNNYDWYSILQVDRRSDDLDLIKRQYRRLALLLHPDKNKFPFADQGFKFVADSWAVLSDPSKKSLYDKEFSLFTKIDLSEQQSKLPVRRNQRSGGKRQVDDNVVNNQSQDPSTKFSSFWTACPYCYLLYEYPGLYEGCCLRCQNCQRAFQAISVPTLPPLVPGQDAYYCCWGFFPMGYTIGKSESGRKSASPAVVAATFPNWMPPMFTPVQQETVKEKEAEMATGKVPVDFSGARGGASVAVVRPSSGKKRGRPRKVPIQA